MKSSMVRALQVAMDSGLPFALDGQAVLIALLRMQDHSRAETWGEWAIIEYTEDLAKWAAQYLDILPYYLQARALYDPEEPDEAEGAD